MATEIAILALCRFEFPGQQPLSPSYEMLNRLQKCPLLTYAIEQNWGIDYRIPASIEVPIVSVYDNNGYFKHYTQVRYASNPGLEGIRELEKAWSGEVEKFLARHQNIKT